jgi:membrane associated rhomboid family serine protease
MPISLLDFPASVCLLVLNIGISLLAFSNERILDRLALTPYRMVHSHEYHQVVTSGFVHANLSHLAFNMITLYFFGPALEQTILNETGGRGAFLFIYIVSLLLGSFYALFKYRNRPDYVAVGASGAVSGVIFSFCLAYPTAMFRVFFAIPMPAWLFAILYVGYSIYAMRNVNDNIGHEAHLAGALGGVLSTFIIAPGIVSFLR